MNEIKFELEGKPNLGIDRKVEKLVFTVEKSSDKCLVLKDSEGKVLISFNPFMDGGSVWLADFSSIILDVENWGEDTDGKFVCLHKQTLENTSSMKIMNWLEDSKKLAKIREAKKLLEGDD